MSCRHNLDNVCKITNSRCIIFPIDEERCSNQNGAIINYLRNIGTYDKKVKNNPEYLPK